jgi:Na+/H+ antiporter 1
MATDTAFAVVLIAMMGHRVPIELRIFLTAAAIVDDVDIAQGPKSHARVRRRSPDSSASG